MKSWKTTLSGLGSALVIALYPVVKTGSFTVETILVAGGVALLGYFAKDSTAYTKDADKAPADQQANVAAEQTILPGLAGPPGRTFTAPVILQRK